MKFLLTQVKLMINQKYFLFSYFSVLTIALVSYLLSVINNMNVDVSLMNSAYFLSLINNNSNLWMIFSFIYPLIIVCPFSFSYIDDRLLMNDSYIKRRYGAKLYFKSKLHCSFVGGFIVIFIPFMINILLCYFTFSHNTNTDFGQSYYSFVDGSGIIRDTEYKTRPFLELFIFNPIVYSGLMIFFFSLFSGLMGMLTLAFSFFIKKRKLLLLIPLFLIYMMLSFINSSIFNNYDLEYVNTNILDYMSVDSFYGLSPVFFGTFLFLTVMFIFLSFLYIVRQEEIN